MSLCVKSKALQLAYIKHHFPDTWDVLNTTKKPISIQSSPNMNMMFRSCLKNSYLIDWSIVFTYMKNHLVPKFISSSLAVIPKGHSYLKKNDFQYKCRDRGLHLLLTGELSYSILCKTYYMPIIGNYVYTLYFDSITISHRKYDENYIGISRIIAQSTILPPDLLKIVFLYV